MPFATDKQLGVTVLPNRGVVAATVLARLAAQHILKTLERRGKQAEYGHLS